MRKRQVHLDFHTSEKIEGIGAEFSKENFQKALKEGHVDSITVFSKCHHGWAYHPSKANEMHPHLNFDLLGAQIEAAHEIGVKTPVYLSAGFDQKYAMRHPEDIWVENYGDKADLTKVWFHRLCFNSPYLEYLLAQIKEVLENYDTDGIFLDIVNVHRCYCPNCVKTMEERGISPDDIEGATALAEEIYENYLRRVRETIDSVKPGHPVFHNQGHVTMGKRRHIDANTHLELETLPTGGYGYDHLPISAAYARNLGMEYLGMTGKFHKSWGEFGGYKHPNALKYEAALTVAQGAGMSVGDQLAPSGKMDEVTYKIIGEAYKEIEAIEPWLMEGKFCSDIAVVSQEAIIEYYMHPDFNIYYKQNGRVFSGDSGASRILTEGQFQFDVVDAESDISKYKVLILPDNILLDEYLTQKIKAFIKNGGKVLATGSSGLDLNRKEYVLDFGVNYIGESEYQPDYMRPLFETEPLGKADYVMYQKAQKIENVSGTELAEHIRPYFNRSLEHFCSHCHAPSSGEKYGAGMVEGKDGIIIPWNIFEEYAQQGSLIAKLTVQYALNRLLEGKKTFTSNLPSKGVATVVDCEDFIRCHYVYAVPMRRGNGIEVIEDIVPLYHIETKIRVGETKIKRVYTVPQKKDILFEQKGENILFTVPEINNQQIVILEKEK